ncbi:MAG: hypothetical protein JWP69_2214 [Flaviaesturariibacter sp.]|nr:hypothetical protein [Flaviaesturariibacter sp.]
MSAAIRNKLYDYIRVADDKKLHAFITCWMPKIDKNSGMGQDKNIVKELDSRYEALQSGKEKGVTAEQVVASIDKKRKKRHERQNLCDRRHSWV